jgi:hypothetical protein
LTSAVETHGTASFKMSDKVSFGGVEEFDEEEVESTGGTSYQSVSEYEGNVANIPKTMFFGPELCRARFHMKEEMGIRATQRRADNIASLETMLGMDGIHLGASRGDTAEWLDAADGAYEGLTDRRGTGQLWATRSHWRSVVKAQRNAYT